MDRVYDEADLAAAELIEMRLSDEDGFRVESGRRDPLGRIELNVGRLRKLPHSRYGCANTGFIVAERIRSELAGRDLKGVAFKPTIPSRFPEGVGDNPHRTEWSPSLGETWWELTSEYWMPLLAMTVDVRHRDTDLSLTEIERKAWKWRQGIRLREGRYKRPELHYTRKSLELWFGRGWDVARLREPLNTFVDDDRRHLVVSQKFYQAFRELGIHAEWVPVRIDET